jgi:hypothetical protein
MASARASLLAAVVLAVGSAAPRAAAQPTAGNMPVPVLPAPGEAHQAPTESGGPVNVLPPRPLPLPTLPVLPPAYDPRTGLRSTAYQSASLSTAAGAAPVPEMPAAETTPTGQSSWLSAPVPADGAVPPAAAQWSAAPAGVPQRTSTGWVPYQPQTAPTHAPGWRWYGYGAVDPGPAVPPTARPTTSPPPPPPEETLQPPQPQPQTPGQLQSWQPPAPTRPHHTEYAPTELPMPQTVPGPAPTELPLPRPLPAAPPANFSTAVEPVWRSAGTAYAAGPANPMVADPWAAPGSRPANGPPTAANHWPAHAVAAQPRPHGGLTTRAVSDAPQHAGRAPASGVQPVGYTAPSPPRAAALGQPQAARPAARAPAPVQRPATPAQPAARTAATAAAARPAQAVVTSLTHLKYSVQRVCAGRGSDVDVQSRGPGSLLVRVRVARAQDAQYLANAISQIPELAPYQVIFEMKLAQ